MTLKALYQTLVGSPAEFEARHRIVNGLALVGAFVTVVWAITDVALSNHVAVVVAALAMAASVALFIHSRVFRRKGRLATSLALATYLVIYATSWFDEGGVKGSSAFLIMLLLPATILIFHGWYRWFAFAAVTTIFAVLTGIEAFDPGVRLYLSESEAHGAESIVAFLAGAVATSALFSVAVRSLRTEVRRSHEYTDRIEALARHDQLTGLLNHTAAWKLLDDEVVRCSRMGRPCSIIMVDLDDFKSVNDVHGHRFGDEILRQVGAVLASNVRSIDRAGRYGGEEFLVVLPDTEVDDALKVACRLLLKLSEIRVDDERSVMASAGLVGFAGRDVTVMVDEADRLLYTAKRLGGARIVVQGGRIVSFGDCANWQ